MLSRVGYKPGKHGKPGKLREFEKLSKFQGKLREILYFCGKTWKTEGKCKICDIILNENVFQRTFLFRVSQGKPVIILAKPFSLPKACVKLKTSGGVSAIFCHAHKFTVVIANFKSGTCVYNLQTQLQNFFPFV